MEYIWINNIRWRFIPPRSRSTLISFPLDFFYMSCVFTSVFLIRVSLSLLPLFVTQIHLPSSFHAHVIAIHPSRGCPSVVVVPFKATLQPLACTRCATLLHAPVTSANFIYINYLCDALHVPRTIMHIRNKI